MLQAEPIEEIVGERLRLSSIENRMNEERFSDLRACVETFKKEKYLENYICIDREEKLVVGNDLVLIERV